MVCKCNVKSGLGSMTVGGGWLVRGRWMELEAEVHLLGWGWDGYMVMSCCGRGLYVDDYVRAFENDRIR